MYGTLKKFILRGSAFAALVSLVTLLSAGPARAQWTTNGATTSTGNSVGVGTTDPTQGGAVGSKFTVASSDDNSTAFATSNGTLPRFALNNHADGSWTMHDYTGNKWNIGITQQAGKVGFGTTSPLSQLHLHGSSPIFRVSGSATDQHLLVGFYDNNSALKGIVGYLGANGTGARYTGIINTAGDYMGLGTTNPTPIYFFLNGAPTHIMSSNGSVGIGTTAPGFKFDVQGGQVNASGGLCIAGDCKTSWAQVGGSQWTTSGLSLLYNSGNVGIATSASNTAKLVIGGTAGAEGLDLATADQYANLRVIRNSNSVFDKDLYLQYGAGAGSKIHFYADNAESMTLSGGRIGIGTTAPAAMLDVNGDIRVSGNINAKYQDVAEWVPTTQKLQAGTVVILDPERPNHVLASTTSYDTAVAGVISERPGLSLGEAGESKALVATTGRVKVRVDATRAPIRIGDLLVTSDVQGVAMKSQPVLVEGRRIHAPGTIVGKALEPLAGGTGEILVLLSLQ